MRILLFLLLMSQLVTAKSLWSWLADDFNPLLRTHGVLNVLGHVAPSDSLKDESGYIYAPGYRSDLALYIDFFEWKGFISHWEVSNTTIIESPDTTAFKLDRIRYTLTPGYRYEFTDYIIHGWFQHECIHTISKNEPEFRDLSSMWWNGVFFGFGSKPAYHLYWLDKLRNYNHHWGPLERLDYNVEIGAFLYGKNSSWVAQNHIYRYQVNSYFKYIWGKSGVWSLSSELYSSSWRDKYGRWENQFKAKTSLFLSGKYNFAAIYLEHIPFDDNVHDNQNKLWGTGFEVIF